MLEAVTNAKDVIVLIILFGFAILVHELGHFLVARWCGMVIDVFSIGFGPSIWKKKVNGITYKIGCIPFGGYVALPQLDPSSMAMVQSGDAKTDDEKTVSQNDTEHRDLPPISPWCKIIVSVAGAAGNIVLAIVLAIIIYLHPNAGTSEGGPLILAVDPDSQAFQNGVRTGDEIISVNDKKVTTWYDYNVECLLSDQAANQVKLTVKSGAELKDAVVPTIRTELGGTLVKGVGKFSPCAIKVVTPDGNARKAGIQVGDIVKEFDGIAIASPDQFTALVHKHAEIETPIVVERNGALVSLKVAPKYDEQYKAALLGVHVGLPGHDIPWMQYKNPVDQLKYDASSINRLLKALVTPREFRQAVSGLGGPVSIAVALWVSIKISIMNGLGFLRFLCVNLAILNMLPIPVLDGGHVMFSLWEIVTRRKIHPRIVNALVNVFASLLIAAIIYLTYKDFARLPKFFKRDSDRQNRIELPTNAVQPVATGK